MAAHLQLDFFESHDPVATLEKRLSFHEKKLTNVQRGLFSRFSTMEEGFNTLWTLVHMQRLEIEELKKMLGMESPESQFTFDLAPLKLKEMGEK